jgi:hypothetical protein
MKKSHAQEFPTSVLPPSVTAAMVYGGLWAVWFVWAMCAVLLPRIGALETSRMVPLSWLVAGTVLHLLFAAWFLQDARSALAGPIGIRRAHVLGIALAGLCLFGLQFVLVAGNRIAVA